jgi:hypothetical protein
MHSILKELLERKYIPKPTTNNIKTLNTFMAFKFSILVLII